MTLYRENPPGAFTPWRGERIGGVAHPVNIAGLWADEDLAAIKLFKPADADPVPEGKVVTETKVRRVDGIVKFVSAIADAPLPSIDDVIAERERRLAAGFNYDFGDERGIHRIGTAPEDMRKWLGEVTPISQAMINAGIPEAVIGVSTDTGPVEVEAMEWQMVLIAAGQWRQPIYQASFILQAMEPIPSDFAADGYWTVP